MAGFTVGELLWRVVVESTKAVKDAKLIEKTFRAVAKGIGASSRKAGKSIIGIAGSLGKLSGRLTKMAAIGLTAFGAASVVLGVKLVNAASAAEETDNKFRVLTKGVEGAEEAVLKLAETYGLSDNAAKTLVSSTSDILQGFGVAKERSVELSLSTQRLAADLVSFSNVSGGTERASAALTSAFTGEREALKAYGIVISEEAIKQELLRQGKDKLTGSALLQAKAEATLKIAYEQSSNAIGDFERSQSSFANQLRIAQANVENLEVTLGTNLIPVAGLGLKVFNDLADQTNELAKEMNEFITSAEGAEQIGDVFGRIAGSIAAAGELAQPIIDALGTAFDTVAEAIGDVRDQAVEGGAGFNTFATTAKIVGVAIEVVAKVIALVIREFFAMGKAIISVGALVSDFFRLITGDISGEEFRQTVSGVGDAFSDLGAVVRDGILDIAQTAKEGYDDIANSADELAKRAADAYTKTAETVKNAVTSSLLAEQQAADEAGDSLEATAKQAQTTGDIIKKVIEETKILQQQASGVASVLTSAMDSVGLAQETASQQRLDQIDTEEQRALESAGLIEKTEIERARSQLEAAIESGDEEQQAEARQQIERLKVQKQYEDERKQAQYETAIQAWELQKLQILVSTAMAAINAFSAAAIIPVIGPALAPIAAVAAGVFGGIQLAAVEAARPTPPKRAGGGFVPGASNTGDRTAMLLDPEELVLNKPQQRKLFDMANGGGGGGGNYTFMIGKDVLFKIIGNGIRDGHIPIPVNRVVSR